eukprot:1223365-Prymnesium_polylepis.1
MTTTTRLATAASWTPGGTLWASSSELGQRHAIQHCQGPVQGERLAVSARAGVYATLPAASPDGGD